MLTVFAKFYKIEKKQREIMLNIQCIIDNLKDPY